MTFENTLDERLFEVVKICAALPAVQREVFKNHDDNQWWPLAITDWRLRLVVAGWSTRVSYNMISTYRRVVAQANTLGYDRLSTMSDEDLTDVVAPIGLPQTRIGYLRSVKQFLDSSGIDMTLLQETENDALINLFAERVKGSGYKVAQCAMLYAKGYHCGIFPVDSGMKDMLGPCLGLALPKGPIGHEVMRKQIEQTLNGQPEAYYALAQQLGYGSLQLPTDRAPTWWAHLALIYFKRRYCNMHTPHFCPLRADVKIGAGIGTMCDRQHPQPGMQSNG